MALLKKVLTKLGEECGGMQDDTAGTQLLSFLVRRNQAEEEEGMDDEGMDDEGMDDEGMDDEGMDDEGMDDDQPEIKSNVMRMVGDAEGELDFDDAEDTTDYSDDQDEFDDDETEISLDVDLDTDEAPDDEAGDSKRLSRLRSLLP